MIKHNQELLLAYDHCLSSMSSFYPLQRIADILQHCRDETVPYMERILNLYTSKYCACALAVAFLRVLKALCHDIRRNCFLMSSLVQKSGYRKYGHAQYHGVVYGSLRRSSTCSVKILSKSSGKAHNLQRYGQPKSKNSDKHRLESR